MGSNYQYYADGRTKFVDDISMETPASDKFDRSYVYDHVGRLTEAKSGTETHTPPIATDDRPYRETFGFDEWNNLNARTGRVWAEDMLPVSAQYTDNRRQGWTYDADGRPTVQELLNSAYDASGRTIKTHDAERRWQGDFGLIITQSFDGNGLRVKQKENNYQPTYLIRSTALGGQAVYEVWLAANQWKIKTWYVYAGNETLAVQKYDINGNQQVEWLYSNPVTGSKRGTVATELDPLGLNAGLSQPGEPPIGGGDAPDLVFPRFGDILNGSSGCTQDGAMVSCDQVAMGQEAGAVTVLPEGVSTIMLVLHHDIPGTPSGVPQIRGTNLFIDPETGDVYNRRLDPNWETPDDYIYEFAGTGGSNDSPLSPEGILAIESDVKDGLSDAQCNGFVSAMLAALNGIGNNPQGTTNILDILNAVKEQQGFMQAHYGTDGPLATSQRRTFSTNNGRSNATQSLLRINVDSGEWKNRASTHYSVATRASTVIHELAHFAAAGRDTFGHPAMAAAARSAALAVGFSVVGPVPQQADYSTAKEADNALERYITDLLWRACYRGPTGKRG